MFYIRKLNQTLQQCESIVDIIILLSLSLFSSCHPYHHSSSELISHVTRHVTCSQLTDWPDSCHPYIELLKDANSLLYDYTQARKLQDTGIG